MMNAARPDLKTIIRMVAILTVLAGLVYAGTALIDTQQMRDYVENAGVLAPVVLILLKMLAIVYAPLSGTVLYVAAGPLFGLWQGTLYILIGDTLGGTVAFLIGRRFGALIIAKLAGQQGLNHAYRLSGEIGTWRRLLLARLFLSYVTDIVSYAVGLTQIPLWQFVLVTIVGSLIPTFIFVAAGTALIDYAPQIIIVNAALTIVLVLWILLRRRYKVTVPEKLSSLMSRLRRNSPRCGNTT